jgi:hypothetical protein
MDMARGCWYRFFSPLAQHGSGSLSLLLTGLEELILEQ